MRRRTLQLLFASYVIPTIFAMFISGIYQIIDGIFVGNFVGTHGLAGINMAWSFATLFLGYGIAVGLGVGSLFSIARGEGEVHQAKEILGQIGVLLVVPGIIFGAVMYFLAPSLVAMMGVDEYSRQLACDALQVFSLGAPLVIGSIALPFIVRNLDSPTRATVFMAIGALINIFFSYLFVVRWGLSVKGAVFANLIGETIAMLLGLQFIFGNKNEIKPKKSHFLPNISLIKAILLNGSSGFFMYIYVGFIMILHQRMLIKYGDTNALAVYTMLGYLLTIYYLTVEGIANGVQPIMSDLYGMNKIHSLRSIIRMTLFSSLGIGIVFTVLLQIFPQFFAHIFVKREEAELLMDFAVRAIRLNLFLLFLEGFFVIATIFFESLGEGHKALWITVTNMLIQVPFVLVLPRFWGVDGVWLTMPLTSIFLLLPVGAMVYFRYQKI